MYPRTTYLNQLIKLKDTDLIKVITGVRRAGKSVLLTLYRDYLIETGISKDQVIYLNMESFENQMIKTADQLYQKLSSLLPKDKRFYLLLDEIQLVSGWERIINGVKAGFDCEIVITGSNAKMLSGELATLLSGRYVEIKMYPLSFKEYVTTKDISNNYDDLARAFEEFETYGGFPTVADVDKSVKDPVLEGIYSTIVLNDIANRGDVRDISVLESLISFMADNVGQLINIQKISNSLKSAGLKISNPTISTYLKLLSDAFLFYRVRQYDLRGKEYLKTSGKYFIVDQGLRRVAIGRKGGNYSNRLENIVFLELLKRGYQVDVGKIESKEIDFIARKNDQIKYFQVTYELPQNTHETDNLLLINDNYEKIVITQRKYYDISNIDGIPIINVVDWLMEDEQND